MSSFTFIAFCFCIFIGVTANKNTQVGVDHLSGDQNVGGIHFFEVHAPNGGSGLGFKLMVVAILVLIILYWCVRRKYKSTVRRYAGVSAIATAAGLPGPAAAALQYLPVQPPAQAVPVAPVHTCRAPLPHRIGPISEPEPSSSYA